MTPVLLAGSKDPRLATAVTSGRPLLLVAVHHHQAWGGPAERVGRAVARVATAHPEVTVVASGHRDTGADVLGSYLAGIDNALALPVPSGDELRLAAASHLVLTDSQRLARAAAELGRPVLALTGSGTPVGRPVGTDEWTVVAHVEQLLGDPVAYAELAGTWLSTAASA